MMAGPRVLGRISHDSGFDRIEMDVSKACDEVAIDINQPCFVSTLEAVTRRAQLSMPKARVTHGDALHQLAQWLVMNLDKRMQVIGHPAEGMQACNADAEAFGDNVVEHVAISGCREELSAVISAENYVIEPAGHMQARWSRHPCIS
jgi:hypothetical protein